MTKSNMTKSNMTDLVGKRIGRLTVIEFSHREIVNQKIHYYKYFWKCKCDCGNEKILDSRNLRAGKTQSCGCLHKTPEPKEKNINIKGRPEVLSRKEATIRHHFRAYRNSANNRGLEFSLIIEEFGELIFSPCFYGLSDCINNNLENEVKLGKYTFLSSNGIDRVDNSKGYISGNCVPCCHMCNQKKRGFQIEGMKKALEFLGYKIELLNN